MAPELEHADRLASVRRRGIDNRRHAVVRRDGEEIALELIAGADIDRMDRVVDSRFLKEHRDLVAVRRGPIVEVDHFRFPRLVRQMRSCKRRPRDQKSELATDAGTFPTHALRSGFRHPRGIKSASTAAFDWDLLALPILHSSE